MTQHHLLRVDGRNGGELNVHDTDPGGPPKWSHLPGAAPVLSRWRNPQKVAPSNWRATLGYDGPHPNTPGDCHDVKHISWQSAGKRSADGERGNIPYDGPQHPSRTGR